MSPAKFDLVIGSPVASWRHPRNPGKGEIYLRTQGQGTMTWMNRLRRRKPLLDEEGFLHSDLWIDQQDAHQSTREKIFRKEISIEQADKLRLFHDEGYLGISLALDDQIFDQIDEDVERLWQKRPNHVAYAYQGLLTRFSDAKLEHRAPSYRIADLHTYSEAALSLYLQPQVFEYIELILGEPAIATQSLYFEWGSQQQLHRDSVYSAHLMRPDHLLVAWIALEDIGADSGPVTYVPGSHRVPYYRYSSGQFAFELSQDSDREARAAEEWYRGRCQEAGLSAEVFTCARGDVLLWHPSLIHGGSPPVDRSLTRKSLVVQYSTESTMWRTQNSYVEGSGDSEVRDQTSRRVLTRDGCRGFDSPLHVASAEQEFDDFAKVWGARKDQRLP